MGEMYDKLRGLFPNGGGSGDHTLRGKEEVLAGLEKVVGPGSGAAAAERTDAAEAKVKAKAARDSALLLSRRAAAFAVRIQNRIHGANVEADDVAGRIRCACCCTAGLCAVLCSCRCCRCFQFASLSTHFAEKLAKQHPGLFRSRQGNDLTAILGQNHPFTIFTYPRRRNPEKPPPANGQPARTFYPAAASAYHAKISELRESMEGEGKKLIKQLVMSHITNVNK